ncbi:uncharacterized protein LOC111778262 isoform X2 [Cucurbita pepo subsp. pepo]|uniref:uncharacterized protein LOC111778262 isoform X2 n=1 Tax=Cucurbita pepo subsp. pepo TaxID=3664 RepID=UPI000C9D5A07|nr:uncharacterized protein LOC111778262 isoform X2 [Cucurbita pepo subsp. pepo]
MASVFAAPPSQLVLSSHRPSLDHKAFLPSIVGVKFHRNGFPIPSFREFLLVCVFSSPLRSIALDTIISEDIWTVTLAMSMLTWKFICCLVLLSESTLILVMEMEFGRYKNTKRLKLRQRSFSITASNSSDGNSTKEKKDGSKVTD